MRFINRARQSGKSSMLVSTAYVMNYPIVVDTAARKENLKALAYKMRCKDVLIITVQEMRYIHGNNPEKVLIDEADSIIGKALNEYLHTNVVAASLSLDIDDLPHDKIDIY